MEQWWNYSDRGNPNYSDSNLSQWHYVVHVWKFNYTNTYWFICRFLEIYPSKRTMYCHV